MPASNPAVLERETALKLAVQMAGQNALATRSAAQVADEVLKVAERFAAYLASGETVRPRS